MWNKRIWDSTKGRIVALLRSQQHTVDELATELSLTDNAVRAQLGPMERDGLVRVAGTRKPSGAGKPAVLYELPLEADTLFSQAYAPMFTALVTTLAERLEGPELSRVLVDAGQRLAAAYPTSGGNRRHRMEAAAAVMRGLGAQVEIVESEAGLTLRGTSCPLAAAVAGHREVCVALQAFVETMLGEPLQRCCSYEDRPRCCFTADGTGEAA